MTSLPQGSYQRAQSLEAALALLAEQACTVLAGGTDVYPSLIDRRPGAPLLDIGGLENLRVLSPEVGPVGAFLRLGALTTWSTLARGALPPWARALAQAAREVGGVQIQNRGTVGGNLCNASPAADGVPALLALGAEVELASRDARRVLRLDQFMLGPRRTLLRADELLTAVRLPVPVLRSRSTFVKLGQRRYLVISIAMVAIALDLAADDRIAAARVAVGACGPVASRLPLFEERLHGLRLPVSPTTVAALADEMALAPLRPIDDVRGSAVYRRDAVRTLLSRGVADLSRDMLCEVPQ